jgi:integrase
MATAPPGDPRRDFFADQRLRGLRPGTIARGARNLKYFEQHAGKPPHLATRADVRSWIASANSPGGAAFMLRGLKTYLTWLVAESILDESPAAGLKVRVPELPQPTASADDVATMLARSRAHSARDHAIVAILASTGARRSEVGLATFADARTYVDSSMLLLRHSKTQARLVPLDSTAERALRKWLRANQDARDDECLWRVKNGPVCVARAVSRHGDGLSPHALRRYWVTRMAGLGMSTASIARCLGWSPSSATILMSTYTKATGHDLMVSEYRRLTK